MEVVKPKWRTVQIPSGMIKMVEDYIKTEDAQNKGITTISAYVTHALRKELDS